ncbi:hypothetical protein GCM10010975_05770 [Comamonas phosphati]|nr:hypothetical protein GCM10010975_05770 [Comamonas phosphati]
MGLLNQIIGAVVAEEALDKVDPEAGLLKKGMAAIAGFEGEKIIEEKIGEHTAQEQQPPVDGAQQ